MRRKTRIPTRVAPNLDSTPKAPLAFPQTFLSNQAGVGQTREIDNRASQNYRQILVRCRTPSTYDFSKELVQITDRTEAHHFYFCVSSNLKSHSHDRVPSMSEKATENGVRCASTLRLAAADGVEGGVVFAIPLKHGMTCTGNDERTYSKEIRKASASFG